MGIGTAVYYTSKKGGKVVDITDAAYLAQLWNGWSVWEEATPGATRSELRYVKRLKEFVTVRAFYDYRNANPVPVPPASTASVCGHVKAPSSLTMYGSN